MVRIYGLSLDCRVGAGKRLSPQQVASLIVCRWQLDHSVDAIMVALVMLGRPMKRREILEVIRRYVESNSENPTYRRLG